MVEWLKARLQCQTQRMLTSLEYNLKVEGLLRVAREANVKRKDGAVNYVSWSFGARIHTTLCFICTIFDPPMSSYLRLWEDKFQ